MAETWHTELSDYFVLPNYQDFALNRNERSGGGVSIHVVPVLKCSVLCECTRFSNDFGKNTVLNVGYVFSVMYRPSNACLSSFLLFLQALFDYARLNKHFLFLVGDLNINILIADSPQIQVCSLLDENGFQNVI